MTTHSFLAERTWTLLTWPARVAQARRDFALLATFGERELRDIGLSGQDLRDAAALPLSQNATHVLARRAQEREAFVLAARTRPSGRGGRSPWRLEEQPLEKKESAEALG